MLQYVKEGKLTIEKVVEKMAHEPAMCVQVAERGFIREGYHADLVLVDMDSTTSVTKENILYKCGWSPFEGHDFPAAIRYTFVNGEIAYQHGKVNDNLRGMSLLFDR
jgi:dihydroorotase